MRCAVRSVLTCWNVSGRASTGSGFPAKRIVLKHTSQAVRSAKLVVVLRISRHRFISRAADSIESASIVEDIRRYSPLRQLGKRAVRETPAFFRIQHLRVGLGSLARRYGGRRSVD